MNLKAVIGGILKNGFNQGEAMKRYTLESRNGSPLMMFQIITGSWVKFEDLPEVKCSDDSHRRQATSVCSACAARMVNGGATELAAETQRAKHYLRMLAVYDKEIVDVLYAERQRLGV